MDLAALYNLYVNDLFTYGCYLGFEREIVKDAIHDVFVKVTVDEGLLRHISHIKFYLFRSLKNRLIDLHKYQKDEIALEKVDPSVDMPFNIHIDVESLLIEKEDQMQVKNAIEQMLTSLTDRQREIIYLRYIQEYDYNQIAELLHISVHGCRKLVSTAIHSLREKFGFLITFLTLMS